MGLVFNTQAIDAIYQFTLMGLLNLQYQTHVNDTHPHMVSLVIINGTYYTKCRFLTLCMPRDFPRHDLGPNISPFPIKTNEQKLPKMVYIITHSLVTVLHFVENFMKIRTKIAKLQMHENLHKNVNENMFSFTFLSKFS